MRLKNLKSPRTRDSLVESIRGERIEFLPSKNPGKIFFEKNLKPEPKNPGPGYSFLNLVFFRLSEVQSSEFEHASS